jgi:hypothetical protein
MTDEEAVETTDEGVRKKCVKKCGKKDRKFPFGFSSSPLHHGFHPWRGFIGPW